MRVCNLNNKALARLVALEESSFKGDVLSQRQWRYLLKRPSAWVGGIEVTDQLVGAVVVLFRSTSSVARLYSIAVAPEARGKGVAQRLLEAARVQALKRGCGEMRAEVRVDNVASIRMFQKEGWQEFGRYSSYYEDGADALRFHIKLVK